MAYTKEEIKQAKELIINLLSEGESLKKILDQKEIDTIRLPDRSIVYTWLNSAHKNYDKTFLNNYARAKEDSADIDSDKIEDIIEKTLNGKYKSDQARTAIDALKWLAGKKRPKKYGDKTTLEHEGEIKSNSPSINLIVDGKTFNLKEKDDNK